MFFFLIPSGYSEVIRWADFRLDSNKFYQIPMGPMEILEDKKTKTQKICCPNMSIFFIVYYTWPSLYALNYYKSSKTDHDLGVYLPDNKASYPLILPRKLIKMSYISFGFSMITQWSLPSKTLSSISGICSFASFESRINPHRHYLQWQIPCTRKSGVSLLHFRG